MKKALKIVSDVLFVIGLVSAVVFFVGHKLGKMPLSAFIVSSGSMEPAIKTGSLVFVTPRPTYFLGDIITFYSSSNKKSTTTHRVVGRDPQVFRVAGDANNTPDPNLVPKDNVVGKVLFSVPYVGFLAAFAKTPKGFILLVIIPATVIVYEELRSLIAELKSKFKKINVPSSPQVRNMLILPIFFALLIPLTLTISYFIDHETAAGNSFVGTSSVPTPTPTPLP